MNIEVIISIVYYCLAALVVFISILTGFVKAAKAKRNAKTTEEKNAADEEMKAQAKAFIQAAEIAYKDVNKLLKSQGSAAGAIKLESVLTKLQTFATEKNYIFDKDYWTKYINEEVEFAKKVNSEK